MPHRLVVDVGNTRIKWGRLGPHRELLDRVALPSDDPASWRRAFDAWKLSPRDAWSISSVHPHAAAEFGIFLADRGVKTFDTYRSAADVPVPHRLSHPETAGADRAFAVLAALALAPAGAAGLVVSCGTAVTVERLAADGSWEGGAIAPGLTLAARALNRHTAQLPLVDPEGSPPCWGDSTVPAMAAGIFWGTVGAVRELIARQRETARDWVYWTGGDAERLAPHVEGASARIIPDLVLMGLAREAGA